MRKRNVKLKVRQLSRPQERGLSLIVTNRYLKHTYALLWQKTENSSLTITLQNKMIE